MAPNAGFLQIVAIWGIMPTCICLCHQATGSSVMASPPPTSQNLKGRKAIISNWGYTPVKKDAEEPLLMRELECQSAYKCQSLEWMNE